MIPMAVIPLIGIGIIAVAIAVIFHRSSSLRQAAKAAVDEGVQDKLKKAKTLDTKLAQDVLGGADIDAAIEEFQKARASVFAIPTDAPWMWSVEELQHWAKLLLASRAAAINSKARVVAFSILVAVALLVIGVDATLYGYLAAPQPMLSPQGPSRPTALPTPFPAPVSSTQPSNP